MAATIQEYHYPNGTLKEKIPYVDDKIQGVYCFWDEKGLLKKKCNFENGVQHGKSEFYNRTTLDGDDVYLSTVTIFENGVMLNSKRFRMDGTLFSHRVYRDDETMYEQTRYYPNGNIRMHKFMKKSPDGYGVNGYEEWGLTESYHENGDLKKKWDWLEW